MNTNLDSKKLNWLIIGGVVVLFVATTAAAYSLGQAGKTTKTAASPTPTNTATALPSTSVAPLTTNSAKVYQRTSTVPSDWKSYSSTKYPVSFSYPSGDQVIEDSKGNPTQFEYEIMIAEGQAGQIIGINNKSLADTVVAYKSSFLNASPNITVNSDDTLTIDGNSAEIITYTQNYGNSSSVERQYFVFAHGNTYTLPVVFVNNPSDQNLVTSSLQLVESIHIH